MAKLRAAKTTAVLLLMYTLIVTLSFVEIGMYAATVDAVTEVTLDRYRVTLLSEKMPLSLSYGSAAWNGKSAFIFGGWGTLHASAVIVKFDPRTSSATALLDNLPSTRTGTAAIYANGTVYNVHNVCYIFGGASGSGYYDPSEEIVRFFPSDSWWDIRYETIPRRMDMSAIWDGKAAYLFGGKEALDSIPSSFVDDIVKYDPERGSVTTLSVTLPSVRADSSAVWDGENAYIFGGWRVNETQQSEYLNDIIKFNPDTGEIAAMGAKLPEGRAFTSAVWDGHFAYIFGGQSVFPNGTGVDLDEIARYDPRTDTVQVLPVKLPFGTEAAPAVWTGSAAYIFGGRNLFHGGNSGDNIVMMTITPEANPLPEADLGLDLILPSVLIAIAILVPLFLYIFKKRWAQHRSH